MEINRREVCRYLGLRGTAPDERTAALIEDCIAELQTAAAPHHSLAEYPVKRTGPLCELGPLSVESAQLSNHLRACPQAYLFAATLGPGPDGLIRRAAARAMSRAVVLQAAAAAMVEAYCDEVCRGLRESLAREGHFLRPRFSPGYGDFPLTCQRGLLRILEAEKRIGLTATESGMLAPSKSVTAVIGVTLDQADCHAGHCEACGKTDCPFREAPNENTNEKARTNV